MAIDRVEKPAGGENRNAEGLPNLGEPLRLFDHDEARHQRREQVRGQVERAEGQRVRPLVPQSVSLVENADQVRRAAPTGDQHEPLVAPGFEVCDQAVRQRGPVQQAATDLDDDGTIHDGKVSAARTSRADAQPGIGL